MKVAVLLSSYNGENYIETQIDSILAQQGDFSLSLWVRDDGSTDGTQAILQRYADAGKLQWQTGENLRSAKSFLQLLHSCPGYDYYAFADQDDYWLPDKLSCGIRAIEEMTGPALSFSNAQLVDSRLQSLGRNVYKRSPRLDFKTLSCAGGILGCTIVFNRALAEKVQHKPLPDAVPMHDFYLSLLCLTLGGTIVFDPVSHIRYRQHGSNVVGVPNGFWATLKNRLADITTKEKVSIAVQAQQILQLYGEELSRDKHAWLTMLSRYDRNLGSRLRLACSRKTRYASRNMALKLRLSILLGNR